MDIIGRENEIKLLTEYENSGKAEFVTIYGRRRVGKTFLIRELFDNKFTFEVSGIVEGEGIDQLKVFTEALMRYGAKIITPPADWFEAFACLEQLLSKQKRKKRCIVFIDEMPCFDTHGSKFVMALDHFWNSPSGEHHAHRLRLGHLVDREKHHRQPRRTAQPHHA